jgi:hypothetical protein
MHGGMTLLKTVTSFETKPYAVDRRSEFQTHYYSNMDGI